MSKHRSPVSTTPESSGNVRRLPPIIASAAALYVPAAFVLCSYLVRRASSDDYLTPELRRAFTMSHLPASAGAVALCLISILRHERHLWIASTLLLIACAWLGLAVAFSH